MAVTGHIFQEDQREPTKGVSQALAEPETRIYLSNIAGLV